VHVRRVAGEEDPAVAIGGTWRRRCGSGEIQRWVVHAEVGAEDPLGDLADSSKSTGARVGSWVRAVPDDHPVPAVAERHDEAKPSPVALAVTVPGRGRRSRTSQIITDRTAA